MGGRIGHAAGDLAAAETLLGEALTIAAGADRVTAAAWLGVLRAHQSRVPEALELLRPAARGQIGVEHTSATLHALLFLGLAHALAGQPQQALDAFARYTAEVERRQVPRFAGRGVNLTGWVLRSLGARAQAADLHAAALEIGRGHGTAEVTIAALEDHAEQCVENGDPDGAAAWLAQASDLLRGDLVFGWRLDLKLRLLTARLALLCGEPDRAAGQARELERRAQDLAIPRYVSVARLTAHRASLRLGQPATPGAGRSGSGPAGLVGGYRGLVVDRGPGRRLRRAGLAGPVGRARDPAVAAGRPLRQRPGGRGPPADGGLAVPHWPAPGRLTSGQ